MLAYRIMTTNQALVGPTDHNHVPWVVQKVQVLKLNIFCTHKVLRLSEETSRDSLEGKVPYFA